VLVVNWLNVDAHSSLDTEGCANAGLADLPMVGTVALAERFVMRFKHRRQYNRSRTPQWIDRRGSIAAQFALATPVVILIAAGIADFGIWRQSRPG
jgi:TadE-like protein